MAIDARIPLMLGDTGAPFKQLQAGLDRNRQNRIQDTQLGMDQEKLQMLREQAMRQKQTHENAQMKERDMRRLREIVPQAFILKKIMQDNPEQALPYLKGRRRRMLQRIKAGEDIDLEETDSLIAMFEGGGADQVPMLLDETLAAGAAFGLDPHGRDRQLSQRDRALDLQEMGITSSLLQSLQENQGDEFKQAKDLRSELTKVTEDFTKVEEAYSKVLAVESTPAGDLAMIFNYMKMLDPGSAVREGEFSNAEKAAPWLQRMGLDFDKFSAVWEGRKLTEAQRQDFLDQAGNLFNTSRELATQRSDVFLRLADSFGINRDLVQVHRQTGTPGKVVTDTGGDSAILREADAIIGSN